MSDRERDQEKSGVSRRDFLKMASAVAVGLGFGGGISEMILAGNGVVAIPASGGYLLVDTMKCSGCQSCMLACSLAHEGVENPSLARIQVLQDPFGRFPDDLTQEQCRQCVYPACVEACPTQALQADPKNGNVRLVDERKCIGCERCVAACPHTPSRAVWNFEKKHSQKCDLCANTPFWKNHQGGSDGTQACVEICPMNAIKFTRAIPNQTGNAGYQVNLRGAAWVAMVGGGGGH